MNLCIFGGSSGIGLGLARAAHEQGISVTVVGRDSARLEQTGLPSIKADVTSETDVGRVLSQPFDHVVLTAAAPYYALTKELDFAKAQALIDSKLKAALLIAKYSASIRQSITLTTGVASIRPAPRGAVIAAVNGALDCMVKALALELAPLRVNAISPGWVDTPIWDAMVGSAKADTLNAKAQALPVKRIGHVSDIAEAFLFVMRNGFTTGQTLHIDGGHQLV